MWERVEHHAVSRLESLAMHSWTSWHGRCYPSARFYGVQTMIACSDRTTLADRDGRDL